MVGKNVYLILNLAHLEICQFWTDFAHFQILITLGQLDDY